MERHRYDLDPIRANKKDRDLVALFLDGKLREAQTEALIMLGALLIFTPAAIVLAMCGFLFALLTVGTHDSPVTIDLPELVAITLVLIWLVYAGDQFIQWRQGRANRVVFLSTTLGVLLLILFSDRISKPTLLFFLIYGPLGYLSLGAMGFQYSHVMDCYIEDNPDGGGMLLSFQLGTLPAGLLFHGYVVLMKQIIVCRGLRRDEIMYAVDILYAAANNNRTALKELMTRVGADNMRRMVVTLEKLKMLYVGKKDLRLTDLGEYALGLRTFVYE